MQRSVVTVVTFFSLPITANVGFSTANGASSDIPLDYTEHVCSVGEVTLRAQLCKLPITLHRKKLDYDKATLGLNLISLSGQDPRTAGGSFPVEKQCQNKN